MKAYPKKVRVNDNLYDINTDYKVALKCLEILNNDDLSTIERVYGSLYTLLGFIPKEDEIKALYDKMLLYLGCGETQEQQKSKVNDIDLNYDYDYISASFRSDYNIDIRNTEMHWYEFVNLISGFTDKTIMSRVRDIRNFDMNQIKDPIERSKIMKAKENVALPSVEKLTYEEQEMLDEFERLLEGGDNR